MSNQPRVAVVTGASSGIGEAVAVKLVENSFRVIGLARDFSKCVHADKFDIYEIDFAKITRLPEQLRKIERECGAVNAVVCCAGRGQFGSLEEFSYQQIAELMELNFTSQAFVARTFLPGMKRAKSGDLIFIGSESALSGGRRGAVYSASKAALRGFCQALREECGRSGVRVSIVNPGLVKTPFFDELHFEPGADSSNYILPENVAEAVMLILNARPETVFDEINLSPIKNVINIKKDTPKR